MTNKTTQMLMNELDALLDEERDALLAGNLEAMSALVERKEDLISALNARDPQQLQADLADLQGKVSRNQTLLDGALEGIRAVTGRLAEFRKIRLTLETYDQTGQKTAISDTVERKVEKRA